MADFEDKDMGWREFVREFMQLGKDPAQVSVGFFTEEVATYATVNEMGSPSNNIPERPFMRTAFDVNEKKYTRMMGEAMGRALDSGDDVNLLPLGNEVRNDLIDEIITWTSPPNEDSTIEEKGFDNPLVDTGQMQRAIEIKLGDTGDE